MVAHIAPSSVGSLGTGTIMILVRCQIHLPETRTVLSPRHVPLRSLSHRRLAGKARRNPGWTRTLASTPRGTRPTLPTPSWEAIGLRGSICLPTSQHLFRINTRGVTSAAQQTPFYRTIGSIRQKLHFHCREAFFFAFFHVTSMAVHMPRPCWLPALFYFAKAPSD